MERYAFFEGYFWHFDMHTSVANTVPMQERKKKVIMGKMRSSEKKMHLY